jgi:chromosome segregation ATPase
VDANASLGNDDKQAGSGGVPKGGLGGGGTAEGKRQNDKTQLKLDDARRKSKADEARVAEMSQLQSQSETQRNTASILHTAELPNMNHTLNTEYEDRKSDMTGTVEERRQLIAQLTEQRDTLNKQLKAKEDELSHSKQDLVSTRQQLKGLQGLLTQSQSQGETQRKQLEGQQQLVAKSTEQRDSLSRNAQVNKDKLLRSNMI